MVIRASVRAIEALNKFGSTTATLVNDHLNARGTGYESSSSLYKLPDEQQLLVVRVPNHEGVTAFVHMADEENLFRPTRSPSLAEFPAFPRM